MIKAHVLISFISAESNKQQNNPVVAVQYN